MENRTDCIICQDNDKEHKYKSLSLIDERC